MSDPRTPSLAEELESRQEEVIRQLDELLARIEQTIAEFAPPEAPKLAEAA